MDSKVIFKMLLKNNLLKLFFMMTFIFLSNRFVGEQVQFLMMSENPFRNLFIYGGIWGMALYICFKIAFIPKFTLRLLLSIPILISAYCSEMFFYLSQSALEYADVTNLWLSRDDFESAFASYNNIIFPSFLAISFGVLGFGLPRVTLQKSKYNEIKILIGEALLLIIILGGVTLKGGGAAKGLPEQFKTVSLFVKVVIDEFNDDFNALREKAPKNNSIKDDAPSIVYIVDESVRADFIDLNNPKWETTPYLYSIKDKIINYGYASSGHNCSHFSNAMLRYGASQKNLSETLLKNPSLWGFALNSNYNTVYVDAQKRLGSLQNFMQIGERKLINEFIQFDVDQVEKLDAFVEKDHQAANEIAKLLSRQQPQFIYLNKEGVHMPYEGKYPQEYALFKPHMSLSDSISKTLNKERLINSYRNAIRWSVDEFFQKLLMNIDLSKTIIIYTSDHGQNLLDKGIGTHCSSSAPHQTVGLVPLFIITEHAVKKTLLNSQPLFYNQSSHFNIAPTILSIFNYTSKSVFDNYDASLFAQPLHKRLFYTGDIIQGQGVLSHKVTAVTPCGDQC